MSYTKPNAKINLRASEKYIASIIGNKPLATTLYHSIKTALSNSSIKLVNKRSVKGIFNKSLNNSIRDIENSPYGHLLKRLIEFGSLKPDEKDNTAYEKDTILSDKECVSAVNFILSFIINKFKGELAELLAIEPGLRLLGNLKEQESISEGAFLCFGDYIHEYQNKKGEIVEPDFAGVLVKGADGLIVEKTNGKNKLNVRGIIEIKSMYISPKKLLSQINKHISRLQLGLVLGNKIYKPDEYNINKRNLFRIMIIPSSWQVNRKYKWEEKDGVSRMVFPEPDFPRDETTIEEVDTNTWEIKLNWSQDALAQAAYEMSFWYMSQVGKSVYANKPLPKGWEDMSPEEAGYNSIKEKLYYLMLRPSIKRQERRAIKLYNVYNFGYPLGIDSNKMLWPEDFNYPKEPVSDRRRSFQNEPSSPKWNEFQKNVAFLFRKVPLCEVFLNHKMQGVRHNFKADVLVKYSFPKNDLSPDNHKFDLVFNIIVECKQWKTKVTQEVINVLSNRVMESGASMGILVSEKGFQKGIHEYLKHPGNVRAITYDELETYLTPLQRDINENDMQYLPSKCCQDCGVEIMLLFDIDDRQTYCRDCYANHTRYFTSH